MKSKLTLFTLLAFFSALSFPASGQEFELVRSPQGISVQIPRDWKLIEEVPKAPPENPARERLRQQLGENQERDFAHVFSATPDWKGTYALLEITQEFYDTLAQKDFKKLESISIWEWNRYYKKLIRAMVEESGYKIDKWTGTRISQVGGYNCFSLEYHKRSAPSKSPIFVQMNGICLKDRTIFLNISYMEKHVEIWQPVFDRVKESFQYNPALASQIQEIQRIVIDDRHAARSSEKEELRKTFFSYGPSGKPETVTFAKSYQLSCPFCRASNVWEKKGPQGEDISAPGGSAVFFCEACGMSFNLESFNPFHNPNWGTNLESLKKAPTQN